MLVLTFARTLIAPPEAATTIRTTPLNAGVDVRPSYARTREPDGS